MTSKQISLDDYVWLTADELCTPRTGTFEVRCNYWWQVDAQGRVALYNPLGRNGRRRMRHGSPQANPSEQISRTLFERGHNPWAVDVIQVPVAYLPHDCADYVG